MPSHDQLKCLILLLSARHVVLQAVTGSGKTLAMILPLLLSPNKIAITVTPLKLLQQDHSSLHLSIKLIGDYFDSNWSSDDTKLLTRLLISIQHIEKLDKVLL
ncbi:hypothetical protein BDR04DRAFT_1082358 [Suillus decipiens]|nr:hypothetical protein BDR04DRAFT_1082358 [Suillus decipiens]